MTEPPKPAADTPGHKPEELPNPEPIEQDTWTVDIDSLSQTRGQTEAARAASRAVIALCHAAASFNLYDAANEAVSAFIGELKGSLSAFLETHGDLNLEVRAWDIVYADETVFLDRDRERSLPFRLYRDGVRRLIIRSQATWDEIVALLGVVAIRAKGIRQQEDDVVTMLWNAAFRHIDVEAVEGLVAEDDERGPELPGVGQPSGLTPRTALQAMAFQAPYTFDHAPPPLGDRGAVVFREVPSSYLEQVRQQDSPSALPIEAAQLLDELLGMLKDPMDPLPIDDVLPVVREVRSYLLGEGLVREYAQILRRLSRRTPPESRELVRSAFADADVIKRLLQIAENPGELPPEDLMEVARLVGGDQLPALLAYLAEHPVGPGRSAALQLLETQAREQPQRLAERLLGDTDGADRELLRALARVDAALATDVAVELLASANPTVQVEALRILDLAPYGPKLGRALVGALKSASPKIRTQSLTMLLARRERRAWGTLLESFKALAASNLSLVEASFMGEALAQLDPERARPLFEEWLRSGGLIGRVQGITPALRWAAISGLALLPGGGSRELLESLAGKSSGELQRHCQSALARLAAAGKRDQ
jgi:hypothetical protein